MNEKEDEGTPPSDAIINRIRAELKREKAKSEAFGALIDDVVSMMSEARMTDGRDIFIPWTEAGDWIAEVQKIKRSWR